MLSFLNISLKSYRALRVLKIGRITVTMTVSKSIKPQVDAATQEANRARKAAMREESAYWAKLGRAERMRQFQEAASERLEASIQLAQLRRDSYNAYCDIMSDDFEISRNASKLRSTLNQKIAELECILN